MELITSRLRLREFMQGDFAALRDMESRPEMHTYEREPPSETDTRNSLDEYIRDQSETPRTTFRFAITISPQDTVRGILKISRQWEAIREWEVGWAVHPAEWGNGYAVEAAGKVIDWAFSEMNVHRIVAFCHADNAASVRVMEKLGMHQDGRLRETRWLRGIWWDEFVYSILEREWKLFARLAD
jgi:[ribosomal protein S5]-alanine N-acetyltransferase